MYRRAIVIGAQGFVGQHLVTELQSRGIAVTAIVRRPWVNRPHDVIEMRHWNPRHLCAILEDKQPEIIFHLAGSVLGSAAQLRQTNVGIAEVLVEALKDSNQHPSIIFAGSAAEYGAGIVDGAPVTEDTPCIPVGDYGASKLIQTQVALKFASETASKVVVARIFNAIGAAMPSHLALGSFAAQIASLPGNRGALLTGNLDVSRDFIDVKQVATTLCDIAVNPNAHGVVNICSGQPVQLRSLVDLLIAASGKSISLKTDPARLRPGEHKVIVGSAERLRQWCKQPAPTNFPSLINSIWSVAQSPERHAG
jgi:GDP-4-dehydro-6-deoxy-D-mannose reductase